MGPRWGEVRSVFERSMGPGAVPTDVEVAAGFSMEAAAAGELEAEERVA